MISLLPMLSIIEDETEKDLKIFEFLTNQRIIKAIGKRGKAEIELDGANKLGDIWKETKAFHINYYVSQIKQK